MIGAADAQKLTTQDDIAAEICSRWEKANNSRQGFLNELDELYEYITATDTSTTSNSSLPWRNKTTIPQLAKIRDNLHAQYLSALFPNDDWLTWEGYDRKSETRRKKEIIRSYISNKARLSGFQNEISKCVYDYIDTGNAFVRVDFKKDIKTLDDGEVVINYVGPVAKRVSIYDIVFDATAESFDQSWKIVRNLYTLGDLAKRAKRDPLFRKIYESARKNRKQASAYNSTDWRREKRMLVDGFGSLKDYYSSGLVEVLEFFGDIYDLDSDTLYEDHHIVVVDRRDTVHAEQNPSWLPGGPIFHTRWRKRPDSLYGMSPLAAIVGMQYRLDHVENMRADFLDLTAAPPLKIKGMVPEFDWGPFEQIPLPEDGDIEPIFLPNQALALTNDINMYMAIMEEMAGAPKTAMGFRTPGEKTAFEVSSLTNAANRIFQEKATNFEIELLEPALNAMLETARRNIEGTELIRVFDTDIGAAEFISITKDDITAKGKLRPIGARHFNARNLLMQNFAQLSNSNLWAKIERHISSKALAQLVEDAMQFSRFGLVEENIKLYEDAEAQRVLNQLQEDILTEQQVPLEGVEE